MPGNEALPTHGLVNAPISYALLYIGIGAGLAGPVLAGPLFCRINEIHYKYELRVHFVRMGRTTSKVPLYLSYPYRTDHGDYIY